jgi:hypothetical protein
MKNNKRSIDFDNLFGIGVLIFYIFCVVLWLFFMIYPRVVGNKTAVDLKYKYTKAITSINGEKFEIDIDTWNDYEGEQIQIIGKDGKVYLVSSFNTVLIGE